MNESPKELERLQRLIDSSAAAAGPHLRAILTPERRLNARRLCDAMVGMRLIVIATTTTDGRPLVGPVDGYFLHGSFFFSSGRDAVRIKHLRSRSAVSATHASGEELAVTVHGRAELFDVLDPTHSDLHQAMLNHYVPIQGEAFKVWLDGADPVGARIEAEKLFVFHVGE